MKRCVLAFLLGCSTEPGAPAATVRPDASIPASRIRPITCTLRVKENAPCTRAGSVCEFGSSSDPTCNTWFECASDFAYGFYWTEQRRGACASCPADVAEGERCEVDAQLCGSCSCDGGQWACVAPGSTCPVRRPLLGAPCSDPIACDYGSCRWKNGTRMVCEGDVWQIEGASCD